MCLTNRLIIDCGSLFEAKSDGSLFVLSNSMSRRHWQADKKSRNVVKEKNETLNWNS